MIERLSIILFGATGFTGKYCIQALHQLIKGSGSEIPLTWGIAGRTEAKLKEALAECQQEHGEDLSATPIVIADLNNYASLKKMTESARIVINCCGPYRFYGESVVKACIETGTHHVDVTGEPEFMERMQLKYHDLAKEKGVYIVNACGFDSIATDLGVHFLEQHFEGTLNSVEVFMQSNVPKEYPNGMFNSATWDSAVNGFANVNDLKDVRSKLHKKQLPKFLPKLQPRAITTKIDFIDGAYAIPAPSADRSVLLRTQRYLFEHKNKRPIQAEIYWVVKSKFGLFLIAFYGKIFEFLAQREYGRKLLLKYPDFFSNGYFTTAENLSKEKLEKSKLTVELHGLGWDANAPKAENDPHNFKDPPNKTITGSVQGNNPAYGVASAAVVLSAIIILLESDKLPSGGGVYTPGVAFADTTLIKRLHENNILHFNIKSKL